MVLLLLTATLVSTTPEQPIDAEPASRAASPIVFTEKADCARDEAKPTAERAACLADAARATPPDEESGLYDLLEECATNPDLVFQAVQLEPTLASAVYANATDPQVDFNTRWRLLAALARTTSPDGRRAMQRYVEEKSVVMEDGKHRVDRALLVAAWKHPNLGLVPVLQRAWEGKAQRWGKLTEYLCPMVREEEDVEARWEELCDKAEADLNLQRLRAWGLGIGLGSLAGGVAGAAYAVPALLLLNTAAALPLMTIGGVLGGGVGLGAIGALVGAGVGLLGSELTGETKPRNIFLAAFSAYVGLGAGALLGAIGGGIAAYWTAHDPASQEALAWTTTAALAGGVAIVTAPIFFIFTASNEICP